MTGTLRAPDVCADLRNKTKELAEFADPVCRGISESGAPVSTRTAGKSEFVNALLCLLRAVKVPTLEVKYQFSSIKQKLVVSSMVSSNMIGQNESKIFIIYYPIQYSDYCR